MNQYGFPLQGPGWFKVGLHAFGGTSIPTRAMSRICKKSRRCETSCGGHPSAAEAKLAGVDRCMYDVTPDEDFILDYHPGGNGVVIGSGFSGHGFKFGILIGECSPLWPWRAVARSRWSVSGSDRFARDQQKP